MVFQLPLAKFEYSRSLAFFRQDTEDIFLIFFRFLVRLLRLLHSVLSIQLHLLVELYPGLFIKNKREKLI